MNFVEKNSDLLLQFLGKKLAAVRNTIFTMKFNLSVDFGRLSIRFPPPGPFLLYLYIYLYIHSDSIKLHRQKKLLSSQKIILSFFCLHSTLLSGYDIFHLTSETKPLNPLFPSPPPLSSPHHPFQKCFYRNVNSGMYILAVDFSPPS